MAQTFSDPAATRGLRDSYLAQTQRRRLYSGILLLVFVLMLVGSFNTLEGRNAGTFRDGRGRIFDYPSALVLEAVERADRLPGHLANYFPSLIETLNIAAASTIFGAMAGLVLALLSTRGLALWPRMIPLFRRMMDILRAIPEIVIALVLIFILGGGPVPAMIAIALHTAGALGKLFSEVAENADLKPVDGLASVGANWLQRMWLGVIPQISPNLISYAMMRFEVNIRASAILGFVGAVGIGYELRNNMTFGQGRFDHAAAIFLLLFVTIVVVDQTSSYYRNKMAHSEQ